jgi:hypothetical protein
LFHNGQQGMRPGQVVGRRVLLKGNKQRLDQRWLGPSGCGRYCWPTGKSDEAGLPWRLGLIDVNVEP